MKYVNPILIIFFCVIVLGQSVMASEREACVSTEVVDKNLKPKSLIITDSYEYLFVHEVNREENTLVVSPLFEAFNAPGRLSILPNKQKLKSMGIVCHYEVRCSSLTSFCKNMYVQHKDVPDYVAKIIHIFSNEDMIVSPKPIKHIDGSILQLGQESHPTEYFIKTTSVNI